MTELIMEDSQGKKRSHIKLTCSNCNTEFFKPKRFAERYMYNYCSRGCYNQHTALKNEEKNTYLTCSFCGSVFKKLKSRLKTSKHGVYFCSRECKDKGQRVVNGITEIHPPHYNTGSNYYSKLARTEHGNTCIDCGTSFAPLLSVHHVDGDRENFSINNLEVVCYNHHILRHMREREGEWVLDWKALTPRDVLTHLIEESRTVTT